MAMDSLTIIRNANDILAELDKAKAEEQSYDLELKQLKKRLDAEMQMIADTTHRTVTERRGEIEENYRKEAAKVQDRQKKARTERSKARAEGVKNRIQEETADLWEENRRLKREMNARMKQAKVPPFCKNTFYYALYFTRGWKEILILLVTFLTAFLLIPCGVYFLIPGRKALYLVFIYIAAVIIFFGAYVIVGNCTKDKHIAVLKEGRKIRNVIAANGRRIRTITRSIEKDQDEQLYQLEDYDQRLEQLAGELRDIERRKEEALQQFDQATAKQIEWEINENSRGQIESLKDGIAEAQTQCEQRHALIQTLNLKLTDEYVPYLGTEFMNQKTLDGLEKLIVDNEAANLTEAKSLYLERNND